VSSQNGLPRDDVAVVVVRAVGGRAASLDLTGRAVAAPTRMRDGERNVPLAPFAAAPSSV
jgi:hypothetical protein